MEYVRVQDFGDSEEDEPTVVLVCTHSESGNSGPLFSEIPDLEQHFDSRDRTIFADYLDLETDVGSEQVALEAAQNLSVELGPDSLVRLVRVRAHRAVLDCNRQAFNPDGQFGLALRNVWTVGEDHFEVFEQLEEIHRIILSGIFAASYGAKFILDVHTMAAFTPVAKAFSSVKLAHEGPGNLAAYVDSYVLAKERGGARRPVDVITAQLDPRVDIADTHLSEMIREECVRSSVPVDFNTPYSFGHAQLVSTVLMKMAQTAAACVDISKAFLTDEPDRFESEIVRAENLSPEKIQTFGKVLSDAVVKRGRLGFAQ